MDDIKKSYAESQEREAKLKKLRSTIITSSTDTIVGYRILRHVKVVTVYGYSARLAEAEDKFREEVDLCGASGAINYKATNTKGVMDDTVTIQGDAVQIERMPDSGQG